MKVYIGPYVNWFGPYQCANLLRYIGVSEDTCDNIGNKIPSGPFNWLQSFKKRKVNIKIDPYDTWSMDHTLSFIIVPMLKQLRDTKHGSPFVDDEDIPDHLKKMNAETLGDETIGETDSNFHKRWEWVMDEMIFAFEAEAMEDSWESQFYSGDVDFSFKPIEGSTNSEMVHGPNHTFKVDEEGRKKYHDRMINGFRLFGKYYQSL